jgi:hypothetical protein
VATDYAPDHSCVSESPEAATLTVADSQRVNDRQIARMTRFEKPRFDRGEDGVWLKQPAA